jgi:hypothetical protein
MMNVWRPLVAAVALSVTLGVGTAAAQKVMVRNAPAGEAIEVALNGTNVGTGTASADGVVTIPLDLSAHGDKKEIDANVFVDACDKRHRVIVVERGQPIAPQEPGCDRREVSGLFWVRPVNTLVVDVGGPAPTMMLVKGNYSPGGPPHTWAGAQTGLVVFGGAGLAKFNDFAISACGSVTPCDTNDSGVAYTAGATYWITKFLGVEGSYIRPPKATVSSSTQALLFNTSLDAHVFTIAGKIGIPAGPVRFYGSVGTNYHTATSQTSEAISGATQTFQFKTKGWNWMWAGGGEVWLGSYFALYGELGFARLRASSFEGTGVIDDHLRSMLFGGRVRIGL